MKKTLVASVLALGLIISSYYFVVSHKFVAPDSLQVVKNPEIVAVASSSSKIVVTPSSIIQGEPVMIRVENLNASTSVRKVLFAGKSINFFLYDSKPTAFVAIDLNNKIGEYAVDAQLGDGNVLKSSLIVLARAKFEAPLGIPAKLGGNSTTSQKNLVNNLTKENATIKALPTAPKILWNQSFQYPIKDPIVTDPFGYSRLTGAYTISHLGVDFRASVGTSVMAMNKGIVRFARMTVVYGNMIAIDHGLGMETLYAHLSKINISEGQVVEKGQIIGASGQTGYAEQPHLHVSVKINNISVDPISFLNLFK